MSIDPREKRKHARTDFNEKIKFSDVRTPEKIIYGATVDISDSGICMYTFDNLRTGQSLEIKDALPLELPCKIATVKWVKSYAGDFYKAGMMFMN